MLLASTKIAHNYTNLKIHRGENHTNLKIINVRWTFGNEQKWGWRPSTPHSFIPSMTAAGDKGCRSVPSRAGPGIRDTAKTENSNAYRTICNTGSYISSCIFCRK